MANTTVTRNNLFYSQDEFDLEMMWLEDYIEGDTNQTIVVYQVDRVNTQINTVYQDSHKDIHFYPPVEVPCLYEITDTQLKSYDNKTQNAVYALQGNLTAYINVNTFKKYEFDINRGDYIGVLVDNDKMYYWSVVNDGKLNFNNSNMVGAYRPGFRVITATPVTDEEFKAL